MDVIEENEKIDDLVDDRYDRRRFCQNGHG